MNNRFCSFFKGYLKLNRIKKSYKNHLIFIALDGIGDICYSFCALQELKTTTNKKVLVITREYSSELLKYYECIDNIIVLNEEDVINFKTLMSMQKNKTVFNKESLKHGLFFCHPLTKESYASISSEEKNYIDIIGQQITDSKKHFNILYPYVPCVDLNKFGFVDLSKTVIINPYSNSLSINNPELYKKIVSLLINSGYYVYTNISADLEPLESTLPLKCSLQELYHISRKSHLFISVRSGIIDFSISNKARFIVLYNEDKENWLKDAYSLAGWKTSSEIYEFDCKEEEKIIQTITSLCCQ